MSEQRIQPATMHPDVIGTIQPGSTVFGSDGSEVGSIVEVGPDAISVKKRGILAGTVTVARSLVAESDEGRVELTVPAREAGER